MSCCSPRNSRQCQPTTLPTPPAFARMAVGAGMLAIPGGRYRIGAQGPLCSPGDGEGPPREIWVDSFLMDATTVTNTAFERFVRDTGYVTDAERLGASFVFVGDRIDELAGDPVEGLPWWRSVPDACWRTPEGAGSTLDQRGDHPVVHVSWHDAQAFASWAGKRLPSEAEWEVAARGGLEGAVYPWGDELAVGGLAQCNIWQGDFPYSASAGSGRIRTLPARSFAPNGHGLYQMVGNVWEWCADWWNIDWHAPVEHRTRINPRGPEHGSARVIRGGSFLCHASYCNRYRVSARSHNTPSSSAGHMGFRCAL